MSLLHQFIDHILHLNVYLPTVIEHYGKWVYGLLFLVFFCETGLVITPFLPGDSLLFTAGALAANQANGTPGSLNIGLLLVLLLIAPILGNSVNYIVGHFCGPELKSKGKLPFIKQKHLERTHKFYEKYGKSTIILAQFVPIVRTFSPFMAGVGAMQYRIFITFNVIGAVIWVNLFLWSGYLFGQTAFVQKNFHYVILAIMVISVVPLAIEFLKFWMEGQAEAKAK